MLRGIVLLLSFSVALSFTLRPTSIGHSPVSPLRASGKEEEIAKLEEQLRKLKEDESGEPQLTAEEKKYVADAKVLENVQGKDMLLSERELIDAKIMDEGESGGGLGGSLTTVLAVVGAAVFLFFFAQVPVGQEDLSRYSTSGSGVVTTIDLGDLNTEKLGSNASP